MLKLGFSSCPNDTFMFSALVNNWIKHNFPLQIFISDIEELNSLVLEEKLDISKISFHILPYIEEKYSLLEVGAAFSFGSGPILITREEFSLKDLYKSTIAVPRKYTTAYLLFRIYAKNIRKDQIIFCLFSEIIDKVKNKEVDFGLLIHEGRFVYKKYGLKKVLDFGKWWEKETKLPLPLGGIVIKKALEEIKEEFSEILRESILFAYKNEEKVLPYVKSYAKYLDDEIIKNHIKLYVNSFTLNLGDIGKKAIKKLTNLARCLNH